MKVLTEKFNITPVFIAILLLFSFPSNAQETEIVKWLTFEELEDALATNPKKVFIDFYTDWCSYCRKMDKVVFTKPEVVKLLNNEFYTVRFNAETDSQVSFGGQRFINDQIGKTRNPVHQIAQILALREGLFVAPTIVLLDEEFKVQSRYFQYMDSKKLLNVLNNEP